jgi:hypothetical protein
MFFVLPFLFYKIKEQERSTGTAQGGKLAPVGGGDGERGR